MSDTKSAPLLVVAGCSGVGKSVLIGRLVATYPSKFTFSVSHTTREARPKEQDGVDYHFVTKELMQKKIKQGEFLEHATVHNNIYGTSTAAIQRVHSESGKICVLDVDVQGVKMVKENNSRAAEAAKTTTHELVVAPFCVFIAPPSIAELESRLRGRGTETEESLKVRLGNARKELDAGRAPGNFDHVLVNDDLEVAWQELERIVRKAFPAIFDNDESLKEGKTALAVRSTGAVVCLCCTVQ